MSDIGSMELQVTADIGGMERELAKGGRVTKNFADTASKSLKNASNASNVAGQSLINLGRVAQDAPFGFIGIANNINPLLESFQRLKKESGTTGGAIKALGGSLMGAGGLGLAVSVVTGLLTVMSMKGFGGVTKAAKESAEATKKAADNYKSILSSMAEEATKVSVLVELLNRENISRKQREEAIKRLQQIAPEYFANLNAEKSTVQDIAKAYDLYSQSILRNIEAKVREKELINITEKIIELQRKGADIGRRDLVVNGKIVQTQQARIQGQEEMGKGENAYQQLMKGTLGLTIKEQDELQNLIKTRERLLSLVASNTSLDILNVADKNKKAKDVLTIAEVLEKLRLELLALETKELNLGTDETANKMKAIGNAIEDLIKKVKVNPQDKLIVKLFGDITDLHIEDILRKLDERFKNEKVEVPIEIVGPRTAEGLDDFTKEMKEGVMRRLKALKIPFNPFDNLEGLQAQLKEVEDRLAASLATQNGLVEDFTLGVVDSFAQMFAAIATNPNMLGSIFKGLLSMAGEFLIQMGKAAIAASSVGVALKKVLSTPMAGFAAGAAAIIVGNIIKNIPGFANGVTNFSGGLAMVGERGPELVRLPRGSDVIPNHALSSIDGGRMVFIPNMVLKGQDIVVSFNRASKTLSRVG